MGIKPCKNYNVQYSRKRYDKMEKFSMKIDDERLDKEQQKPLYWHVVANKKVKNFPTHKKWIL